MRGRILFVLLALLLGCSVGTQVLAWEFRYHPRLGTGLPVGMHRLYAPWAGGLWAWRWYAQVPQRFVMAQHAALATSGGLLVLGMARVQRQTPSTNTTVHGTAQWMPPRAMRQAGLFADKGLYLGTHRGRYLRH
jgi:type IV secretion system protein VirD4